jgi:hypothetical protein
MATLSEDVSVTCEAVPVQIEGRLSDGRWFYFRSRFDYAVLGASEEGPEGAVEESVCAEGWGVNVYRDLSHLGEFGAGCIGIPEAFAMLREMAAELDGGEPT